MYEKIMATVTVALCAATVYLVSPEKTSPPRREHSIQFQVGDDSKTLTDWMNRLAAEGWTILDCRRANDGGGAYASYGLECVLERKIIEK